MQAYKCLVLCLDWKEANSTFDKTTIGKELRVLPGFNKHQEGNQNVIKKEYMDWNSGNS